MQVIFHLSNQLRRTRRGAHFAPAFCTEFYFFSITAKNKIDPRTLSTTADFL